MDDCEFELMGHPNASVLSASEFDDVRITSENAKGRDIPAPSDSSFCESGAHINIIELN